MQIEKSAKTGFCYGVQRALDILEKVARERGSIETLGEVVHNEQVMQQLAEKGVKVVKSVGEISRNAVVLGTHGIAPDIEEQIKARGIETIDTTCPFVHRAQVAARRLSEAGFFIIVFGDLVHSEVKGILGWAKWQGIATTNKEQISSLKDPSRRIGIISQTTQIPDRFSEFVKGIFDTIYARDAEIRIIDTICHDIRDRQAAALELAKQVDLMVVIGGRNSANTNHLAELCTVSTETHKIATAAELIPEWFKGVKRVGITAGASTPDEVVEEIIESLKRLNNKH